MAGLIDDTGYQDSLLALVLNDRGFLRRHAQLLRAEDFKPNMNGESTDRWIIAAKALDHYAKYKEPIGKLIGVELRNHVRLARFGKDRAKELATLARNLLADTPDPKAVGDKLIEWKVTVERTKAIEEIIELNAAGELTTDAFAKIARKVAQVEDGIELEIDDYFETLEQRIARRVYQKDRRFPALMIDPYDREVRAVARGHLGLIMAPYKRGKSLMLIWIARSYCLQGFNVLYFTLEDPREDVEDRFDAAIAEIPVKELNQDSSLLRRRFKRFKRFVRSKLKIIDATEEGISMARVRQIYEQERERGFAADAIIIDYDEEIIPEKTYKGGRRFEFDEIYRSFRRFCAQEQLLGWTAAQTQRGTRNLKILTGDEIGEDIGKAKKVACALALGKGEFSESGIYLHVAAHKFDKGDVGVEIVPDFERMLIYDREATLAAEKAAALKAMEEMEEDE